MKTFCKLLTACAAVLGILMLAAALIEKRAKKSSYISLYDTDASSLNRSI